MRNFVVISLLLTFLSLQTPLHEIVKLPVLVSHYLEHKEQDEEMSLLAFLKIHYFDNVVDSDFDRDMQLPFKHCSSPMFFVFTLITSKVQIELRSVLAEHKDILTGYVNPFLKTDFRQNIWQPPKAC